MGRRPPELPLPVPVATRADVLRVAAKLRRASLLLEAHARRCTELQTEAHAKALYQARQMVRAEIVTEADTR